MSVARMAERAWRREGVGGRALRVALAPAAVAWSGAVRLRTLAYRTGLRRGRRLPAAVISVGNLTVGGTGKTPTALWVAERLRERGRNVAILSRGYGGSARAPTVVRAGEASWELVGDENVLLARRFGGSVVAGRSRADAGALACEQLGADTLVLDDGFQHLAIERDFDLVCVRAGSTRGAAVLPAGPFREPLSSLRRAHAVLLTKGDPAEPPDSALIERLDGRPLFRGVLRPLALVTPDAPGDWREVSLGRLGGRRAMVLSGVADREPFYRMLRDWETAVEDFLEFPDHHAYTNEDWKRISLATREVDLIVTTEKDLVKLDRFPFAREKLMAVRVAMEIENGDELVDQIERIIAAGGEGSRR